jgi:hypothetical protein
MGSLRNAADRVLGLSAATGAIAVSGRIGIYLAFALILLVFLLIAVLALTSTFGPDRYREAAQKVLAIILGRQWPHDTALPHAKPDVQAKQNSPVADDPALAARTRTHHRGLRRRRGDPSAKTKPPD